MTHNTQDQDEPMNDMRSFKGSGGGLNMKENMIKNGGGIDDTTFDYSRDLTMLKKSPVIIILMMSFDYRMWLFTYLMRCKGTFCFQEKTPASPILTMQM